MVSWVAEPFFRQSTARRRTAPFGSPFASVCKLGRTLLTGPGWVRQKLQREERRAAARGTVVVEAATEHLGLLCEAKLADGAKGDRPLAEVQAVNRLVDLFVDVSAELCERAFVGNARGALDSRCENRGQLADRGDRALPGPMYWAEGRINRPVRFSSSMCAAQPATREQANMAGVRSGGTSARSRTTAE